MFRRLRGKIVEVFDTQSAFADKIGVTEQTVTAKLNGRSEFSRTDIVTWSNALGISNEQVGYYFFAENFQNGKVEVET